MMRHLFLRGGLALVLLVALVAGVMGTASPQQKRYSIKFGVVAPPSGMYYAPLVVAQQKGFFDREGVQVSLVTIGPDDNLVRAVAAGALNLGIPELSIAINGNAHGAPVKIVASLTDRYPYTLYAQPQIKTYADLRGKSIAHWTVAPEVSVALIRRLLASGGLKEGEYNLIAGGNMPSRYAALTQGAVAASVLTAPFDLVAKKAGFTALGGLYDIPATFAGVVTNTGWAAANQDAVVASLKALVLGFRYAATPANKNEVVKMLADVGKVDPAVVAPTWDEFYRDQTFLTSWDLVPSQRSMQGVVDILGSLGQIPKSANPLTYFDLQYLNTALRELGR
ncbi:MAG TPA: ABC transporter substrate-binding protein [bacterium]|nr:ABC transporter substrate-binding protein [bacterium]